MEEGGTGGATEKKNCEGKSLKREVRDKMVKEGSARNSKASRALAAIQDTAASVDARRQRRQSDRYTLPTSVLAH